MLKVLIVDDELKICELISRLIDWETLHLSLIGFAHNGDSALSIITEKLPDIIITDIRMPGCDGLKLIQKAKEFKPSVSFIIVSGHSQFEYAQRAIQFGVTDYILKPIKKNDLTHALKTICSKYQEETERNIEKETICSQLSTTEKRLKSNLISDLLLDPQTLSRYPSLTDINQEYCTNFHFQTPFQMFCVSPCIGSETSNIPISNFLIGKIKTIISNELSAYPEVLISSTQGLVFCLVNAPLDDLLKLRKAAKRIQISLSQLKDFFPNLNSTITISTVKQDVQKLSECLYECQEAQLEKIVIGSNTIIEYLSLMSQNFSVETYIDTDYQKNYLLTIETRNYAKRSAMIHTLAEMLVKKPDITGHFVFQVYRRLIDLYNFAIKNLNIPINAETLEQELISDFYYYCNIPDVLIHLLEKQNQPLREWETQVLQKDSRPIIQAKEYIHQHYSAPLTLEIVGNQVGLNPSYFSTLFKKETGKGFVEYLTSVRIQSARQMLTEGHEPIADIAEAIGFCDLKYFTRQFKKETGLTPTDYRKLFSS